MEISLERSDLRDLDRALRREWYLADGTGGYTGSTVVGANTRKYHGLLVVARSPPVRREVHLALLEEEVHAEGRVHPLSTFLYEGAVHPRGFEHLVRFTFDGSSATWEYRFGDLRVRKRIVRLPRGVEVEYWTSRTAELLLRPLVAGRSFHGVRRARGGEPPAPLDVLSASRVPGASDGRLHVRLSPCSEARPGGPWYWSFLYPRERERGYEAVEDLQNAGTLRGPVGPSGSGFRAWIGPPPSAPPPPPKPPRGPPLLRWLWLSSASFLARRDGGWTVVAGHPWFDDWGRDTMVSLPGLCLATRRFDVARSILETWTSRMEGGLIPNLFTENGADYRSGDATLWLLYAVEEYVRATGDRRLLARLYPRLQESVEAHRSGTPAGVRMEVDGLLRCPPVATWMDTRWTPRAGKPVEVQALWHNGLRAMESFARLLKRDPADYRALAERAAASFRAKFTGPPAAPLLDVAEPGEARLRPNGLLALSLPHPIPEIPTAADYLRAVEERLLTPAGLRTLDPRDPDYRGRYLGTQEERDRAYHQGTVWPWLLGAYVSAALRVRGPAAAPTLRPLLEGFEPHLREAGLGTVSEVFDGDPPHAPGGCPSQAWSVAELLRAATLVL